jgi:uncharacterized Rmd1/YagE family protein
METARQETGGGAAPRVHQFYAIAFEQNFVLRQLAPAFPEARIGSHDLYLPIDSGALFIYPFGALVTYDLAPERRDEALMRLRRSGPAQLTTQVIREDYTVLEVPGQPIGIFDGALRVDRFTPARAGIVALTVAQSAAMEYYERLVEQLFARTGSLVERLEQRGSVPFLIRPLNRFIGEAIATRSEVLLVLHLLDKPDAAWEDPAMDRIYDDLRAEFDLVDRYAALESKLRSIQEALQLLLEVGRDRRLIVLELAIVILIVAEIVFGLLRL